MYTEDEAKTKWCPHVRTMEFDQFGAQDLPAAASINRFLGWDHEKNEQAPRTTRLHSCIASECMAWRKVGLFVEKKLSDVRLDSGTTRTPDGWRYVVSYDDGKHLYERCMSDGPATGYCGLAGKP